MRRGRSSCCCASLGTLALMGPMLAAMRAPLLPRRGERLGQFVVGQLQVAGFMIFSILGLSILPAGRAIVLAYTMPLWAIPIELWFAADRPRGGQLIGAAVGFAGLLLFMNPGLVDWSDWRVLAGNAMLLLRRGIMGARLGPVPAAGLAFEFLDPDILADPRQHAGDRRDRRAAQHWANRSAGLRP